MVSRRNSASNSLFPEHQERTAMLTHLISMQKSRSPTSSKAIMHSLRRGNYDHILELLLVGIALLFGVPNLTMFQAFAQQAPLGPHQLDQLVSRIALYPDPLL